MKIAKIEIFGIAGILTFALLLVSMPALAGIAHFSNESSVSDVKKSGYKPSNKPSDNKSSDKPSDKSSTDKSSATTQPSISSSSNNASSNSTADTNGSQSSQDSQQESQSSGSNTIVGSDETELNSDSGNDMLSGSGDSADVLTSIQETNDSRLSGPPTS